MSEARSYFNNTSCPSPLTSRDNVCIDTMRILDSCRDRDCFEDTELFLTEFGQEIISKAGSIRVKDTSVICSSITTDPIQFNRGFYQITVRLYTKVTLEACICIGKTQEFEGVAVTEKKVVLFGGEGCVKTFKSSPTGDFCAPCNEAEQGSEYPSVVVEVVDPVALSVKVRDIPPVCTCPCCSVNEIPTRVCSCLSSPLCEYRPGCKQLLVSLGFFSVIRIERPSQLVISAGEYSIPDKECCMTDEDDPCTVFSKMAFPIGEFSPSLSPCSIGQSSDCTCKR